MPVNPPTWLLLGPKAGDNRQITALAFALGWPCEARNLRFRATELITNRLLPVSLAGLDRRRSDDLRPPWPDLIITAGRRNEPVARWIQARNPDARIVHIGRPWANPALFDLIITTPQYFLPRAANVLELALPLQAMTQERLDEAARQWRGRLAQSPRPAIAVLVGGNSGPFTLTVVKARRLGAQVNRMAQAHNGSLWISNSVRTPVAAFEAMLEEITVPCHVFDWQQDAARDNPYLAYLALADALVVTGESMSMLAEAAATDKPLWIFDLADEPGHPWWRYAHNYRYKPLSHRLAMRLAPLRMRRDVGRIQQGLINAGRAAWLGQPEPASCDPQSGDLTLAADRVRALFGD